MLHHLRKKACPNCRGKRRVWHSTTGASDCTTCSGTGRVPDESGPKVLIHHVKPSRLRQRRFKHGWYWAPSHRPVGQGHGPYPTESEALAAARAAMKGE